MVFRTLAAGTFVLASSGLAQAFTGECLLEVDHQIYLEGACNIEISADGSFTIGVGEDSRSKYFAYVSLAGEGSPAGGYWNGPEAESHASYDLGELSHQGGCWANDRAKVCAWRAGTRP